MTDEGAGVDVDGGHRFGGVDNQVAAGLEHHLALQRLLDLVLDAIEIEDRAFAGVVLESVTQFGHQFADELADLLEVLPRVDADLLDPRIDQVAQGAHGQRQVLVDHRRGGGGLDLPAICSQSRRR